ncbi:MAG: helix-turn-helix domain-containing protein [Chthoniobacter sp.]|nr:helix-turn-helix domain-containing protein [Chthoniobacter sp.]
MSKAADRQRQATIDRLITSLEAERRRQELSLNEVATRAGLSHTMVMRVEKRDRLPTIDTLLRIAEALDVDLGALIQRASKAAKRTGKA